MNLRSDAVHDKIRKGAHENAKRARVALIKNGKFFVAPQKSSDNFKVLFARLAAEGAGRPVDRQGFADGAWTPETLADAISSIDANVGGIELRAVQVWFQDNDNGISNDNIRWLARIFGCDDPEATSFWQAELKAAKERLACERRAKRKLEGPLRTTNDPAGDELKDVRIASPILVSNFETQWPRDGLSESKLSGKSLAQQCEHMMSGGASMNLLIAYWLVFCALGLLNYVLGTLSVTYNPVEGLSKQVGFIWAPTLTVLPLLILPLYIVFVSDLNTHWKQTGRSNCVSSRVTSIGPRNDAGWHAKVNDFSFSFWAIAAFCFLFVFGFQWAGIYLPAYVSGDANGVQIDRYLVALVRPEVISVTEAMFLSAVGYLYTASYIAVFMFGLLFFVIVVLDYHDVCATARLEGCLADHRLIQAEGQKIVWGGFRIVVLALWLATCVKLQITYLSSDSTDFVAWLSNDASAAFGKTSERNGWLENSSISHFTTFMMMMVTATIFTVCVLKVHSVFECLSDDEDEVSPERDGRTIFKMLSVIALLAVNLVLVGRVTGFSLLLAVCAAASMCVFFGPKLRTDWVVDGTSQVLR